MIRRRFDLLVIGGATRDTLVFTKEGTVMPNPVRNPLQAVLLAFEYGAKVKADRSFVELGGGGMNVSIGAARLGLRTGVVLALGDDADAQAILRLLGREHIRASHVQRHKGKATGFSFIIVSEQTGEHVAFLERGANDDMTISVGMLRYRKPRWVYVSSLGQKSWRQTKQAILECGHRRRFRLAWNPGEAQLKLGYNGLREVLSMTDVLLLNRDEATELAIRSGFGAKQRLPALARHLKRWCPGCVVITDGPKGAYVYDGKRMVHGAVPRGRIVDTTGAGDAFGAGFVAGLLRFSDAHAALKLGLLNAAAVCSAVGAQTGLLYWERVKRQLRT